MGRLLGIDYGDVRIGLALSDPLKIIASPFKTIRNKNFELLMDIFSQIIFEKEVEALVLGLPLSLKNQDTKQTKKVRVFAESIKVLERPIYLQDERLSSISAKKSLIKQEIKTGFNKDMVDDTAAAIFLQQFIDTFG